MKTDQGIRVCNKKYHHHDPHQEQQQLKIGS